MTDPTRDLDTPQKALDAAVDAVDARLRDHGFDHAANLASAEISALAARIPAPAQETAGEVELVAALEPILSMRAYLPGSALVEVPVAYLRQAFAAITRNQSTQRDDSPPTGAGSANPRTGSLGDAAAVPAVEPVQAAGAPDAERACIHGSSVCEPCAYDRGHADGLAAARKLNAPAPDAEREVMDWDRERADWAKLADEQADAEREALVRETQGWLAYGSWKGAGQADVLLRRWLSLPQPRLDVEAQLVIEAARYANRRRIEIGRDATAENALFDALAAYDAELSRQGFRSTEET